MVSSAVYRYVENRDVLLTRLIVEAYDSLGSAVERATATNADDTDLERWIAAGLAARRWARRRRHEYLLLYGSPVPGYAAPAVTAQPGTRVPRALVAIVRDASAAGRLAATDAPEPTGIADDLDRLAELVELPVAHTTLVAVIGGWTQMFGLISFELTNQTRGVVTDHAGLFLATVQQSGHRIGLR